MKKRRRVELHGDGTVTCWRPDSGRFFRSDGASLSARDLSAMTRVDRERVVATHPQLRAVTQERTLVRVQLSFVVALPLGSALPSPTVEAIESAALAVAGPVQILPGSRISVVRSTGPRPSRRSVVR